MCFCANVHTFKKHRPYALLWNTQKPHTEQPGNDQKKDQNKQKKLKKQKMIMLVLPSYYCPSSGGQKEDGQLYA